MSPEDIWDLYNPNERAAVKYLGSSWAKWRNDVNYPEVKCLVLCDCDRGIPCWKEFGEFLRRVFPNLQSLMLSQNYSYGCNDEKEHFQQFFNEEWLHYVWINTISNDFGCSTVHGKDFVRVIESPCNCDETRKDPDDCNHNYEKIEIFCKNLLFCAPTLYFTDNDMFIELEEYDLALWPDTCFCKSCDPIYYYRVEFRSPHPPSYFTCKINPAINYID